MKMQQRTWTRKAAAMVSLAAVTLPLMTTVAQAKTVTDNLAPQAAPYGYFVDTYQANVSKNTTQQNNPVVGEMAEFSTYWADGKKLNEGLLAQNVAKAADITQHRNDAEAERSYLTDRRDLRYNLISGLGPYATAFVKNADAQTDFTSMPSEPLPANAPYSKVNWASTTSTLGPLVQLVNTTARSPFSGTGVVKHVVKYVRPYRQSDQVKVVPALSKVMAAAKADDYDFPSGHTTAAFESGLTLAYAVPERFQELLTRSSEVGYDRVLAGRHSPLAVMGGRMVGTAMTAATLNDSNNRDLMKQAYQVAHSDALLGSKDTTATDTFSDYQTNRDAYRFRMTYGFNQTGDTTQAMRVPKGAEVLLATRLPYLSDTQRRDVLYTTGMPSGYPVMDDAEGWGRLDLFSAANGYGALNDNVTVNMDAKQGGFNAKDNWRNDIAGQGQLTKQGSGRLVLSGHNSFNGTTLKAGKLELANATAAGTGNVKLSGGVLQLSTAKVTVKGNYQQKAGQLKLARNAHVTIKKTAKLGGTLKLTKGSLKSGTKLLTFHKRTGKFTHVSGLPKGWHISYTKHAVKLVK
ncbi:phosphatase PAP2 family protein [Levilactobacillus wangkuiensis]|uniref:phosphatase PAP2 family protein n=1 Tax=Levilactobacillus wangkuiensis TaxID=2799566 RepID=UPI001940F562|nr:phosphatase PAP2 family protein [Levilactobacillus wangkuiensis]